MFPLTGSHLVDGADDGGEGVVRADDFLAFDHEGGKIDEMGNSGNQESKPESNVGSWKAGTRRGSFPDFQPSSFQPGVSPFLIS